MRNSYVDLVRGIAIILVVLGHSYRQIGFDVPEEYEYLDSLIYSFHMPLFFLISGFFFSYDSNLSGRIESGIKRLSNILYPTFLWMFLLYYPHMKVIGFPYEKIFNAYDLLLHPYAQFWFMYVLAIITIVSMFFVYRRMLYYAPAIILAVIILLNPAGLQLTVLKALLFFLLGTSIYSIYSRSIKLDRYDVLGCALFLVLAVYCLSIDFLLFDGIILYPLLGCLFTLLAGWVLYKSFSLNFLSLVGRYTLAIYLFHIVVRDLLFTVYDGRGWFSVVLVVVLGVVVPITIYRILPKFLFRPFFIEKFVSDIFRRLG